ncbi:LCP family glycopolymer transferase [Hutsoniella sourekii]
MKKYFLNDYGEISPWKTLRNFIIILLIFLAAGFGYLTYKVNVTLDQVSQSSNTNAERSGNDQQQAAEAVIETGEPFNVLLIGTDGEADSQEARRSDTLMLVNVNPDREQTLVLSIPRDSLANIAGRGQPEKINHAFAYGGVDRTLATVKNFLQIPIDYYAVVNMKGLQELIDALGGIEVTSPLTFEYRGTQFNKGETRKLDGVKAMNFARMRYDDPEGEIGRQKRQKLVIQAIINKALSLNSVIAYPKLLQVVADNVETNVDLRQALDSYRLYLPAVNELDSVRFQNLEEITYDEVFYFHVPVGDRLAVSNLFRQQLNLPQAEAEDFDEPLLDLIPDAEVEISHVSPEDLIDSNLNDPASESDSAASQESTEAEEARSNYPTRRDLAR